MKQADYLPYRPQGKPVSIDTKIWTVEGPVVPYKVGPIVIPCPTRSTVLADPEGGLWIHSPIAHTRVVEKKVAALGPIRGFIAPNTFHHLFVNQWASRFPEADLILAPGLERRFTHLPNRLLGPSAGFKAVEEWMQIVGLHGGKWSELAFFHRQSGSLVFTDLVQNFELDRLNDWRAKFLLALSGAGKRPVISFELLSMALWAGRLSQVRKTLSELQAMPIRRLLISHGAQPTKQELGRMGWNLDGVSGEPISRVAT